VGDSNAGEVASSIATVMPKATLEEGLAAFGGKPICAYTITGRFTSFWPNRFNTLIPPCSVPYELSCSTTVWAPRSLLRYSATVKSLSRMSATPGYTDFGKANSCRSRVAFAIAGTD
jgi:hypothetical protein